MLSQAKLILPNILGIVLFVVVWQILATIAVDYYGHSLFNGLMPINTLNTLLTIIWQESFWLNISASLLRVITALFWSICIAIPLAMLISRFTYLAKILHLPMQFLRMVSPLSWMPIAVIVYESWDGAIIYLLVMASIWPILFATLNGIEKINTNWLSMVKSFNSNQFQDLYYVVLPAVAQDISTGIRLALGVCWMVIVPAEYLGVTSGLGYAINDARDTLSYDYLGAIILTIGFIGYSIDGLLKKVSHYFKWHQ